MFRTATDNASAGRDNCRLKFGSIRNFPRNIIKTCKTRWTLGPPLWAQKFSIFKARFLRDKNSAPSQDGVSVIYWLDDWSGQNPNQQANTTIYWVDNRITEADVRIDAQNFAFTDSTATNPSDVDVQSLALHELGHVLGLKHDDADPSVMATYLQAGTLRRTLYGADQTHVECEY